MIREFKEDDFKYLLPTFYELQEDGTCYFFENMNDEDFKNYWIKKNFHCYIYEENGQILGSYILGPLANGRFSHTANASYIVCKNSRGKGIGGKLCKHSLETAKQKGYTAMQFVRVVATNTPSVNTWLKYGFKIIGTNPSSFNHKSLGFVDSYILHKFL